MFKRYAVIRNLNQVWNRMSDQVQEDYGNSYFQAVVHAMSSVAENGSFNTTKPVSEAVTDGLLRKNPQERYMPAGLSWKILVWVFEFVPTGIMDNVLHLAESFLINSQPNSMLNKLKDD